jgi:hypothetical protein
MMITIYGIRICDAMTKVFTRRAVQFATIRKLRKK